VCVKKLFASTYETIEQLESPNQDKLGLEGKTRNSSNAKEAWMTIVKKK
jgi:hypothetical protein